jgi:hypothetical protein
MSANSTGIAGAPSQIADGKNPAYVAQVYPDGAVEVRIAGASTDPVTGQVTGPRTDNNARITLSERAMLAAMLQESRIQTLLLYCLCTNQPVPDDLDALRREPRLTTETDLIELEN